MKCPHCLGFMVIDACLNMEGERNKVWIEEWRCLNCGEIFDPHTLQNRAYQRQARARNMLGKRKGGSLSCQLTGK